MEDQILDNVDLFEVLGKIKRDINDSLTLLSDGLEALRKQKYHVTDDHLDRAIEKLHKAYGRYAKGVTNE